MPLLTLGLLPLLSRLLPFLTRRLLTLLSRLLPLLTRRLLSLLGRLLTFLALRWLPLLSGLFAFLARRLLLLLSGLFAFLARRLLAWLRRTLLLLGICPTCLLCPIPQPRLQFGQLFFCLSRILCRLSRLSSKSRLLSFFGRLFGQLCGTFKFLISRFRAGFLRQSFAFLTRGFFRRGLCRLFGTGFRSRLFRAGRLPLGSAFVVCLLLFCGLRLFFFSSLCLSGQLFQRLFQRFLPSFRLANLLLRLLSRIANLLSQLFAFLFEAFDFLLQFGLPRPFEVIFRATQISIRQLLGRAVQFIPFALIFLLGHRPLQGLLRQIPFPGLQRFRLLGQVLFSPCSLELAGCPLKFALFGQAGSSFQRTFHRLLLNLFLCKGLSRTGQQLFRRSRIGRAGFTALPAPFARSFRPFFNLSFHRRQGLLSAFQIIHSRLFCHPFGHLAQSAAFLAAPFGQLTCQLFRNPGRFIL